MSEAPKYRINVTSYIEDRVVLAGVDGPVDKNTGDELPVYFIDRESKHTPGPHWEPVNDAAKAKAKACGIEYTGMVPDSMDLLVDRLEQAKQRNQEMTNNQIGRGVAQALIESGALVTKPAPAKTAGKPAEI